MPIERSIPYHVITLSCWHQMTSLFIIFQSRKWLQQMMHLISLCSAKQSLHAGSLSCWEKSWVVIDPEDNFYLYLKDLVLCFDVNLSVMVYSNGTSFATQWNLMFVHTITAIFYKHIEIWSWDSGPWFNIKTTSYQYRKSHCGDKTILRPSYLHNGISFTGKVSSLYWIRALI